MALKLNSLQFVVLKDGGVEAAFYGIKAALDYAHALTFDDRPFGVRIPGVKVISNTNMAVLWVSENGRVLELNG
jgi:hypothetical protein